jgi:hypothetical protein
MLCDEVHVTCKDVARGTDRGGTSHIRHTVENCAVFAGGIHT